MIQDYSLAVKWHRLGAEKGSSLAKFRLGLNMVYGQGLWVNVGEGLSFLKEAAEEGITRAAFELGNFYSKGTAVEQDIEAAIRWYEKAALSWFLKSAKADYARAQAHIG